MSLDDNILTIELMWSDDNNFIAKLHLDETSMRLIRNENYHWFIGGGWNCQTIRLIDFKESHINGSDHKEKIDEEFEIQAIPEETKLKKIGYLPVTVCPYAEKAEKKSPTP